jgi:hypothetical protein
MRTTRRYAYPSKDRSTRMQSNEDVVLAVIRAVEERDADALFELFHDDVELRDAPSLPYTNTARGKTAMREQLETAPEAPSKAQPPSRARPARRDATRPGYERPGYERPGSRLSITATTARVKSARKPGGSCVPAMR